MLDQKITLNGRYELLERVGSGGMAAVYKAQDRALGRIVAVKMLHENLTSDQDFLRRFQHEAYAAANLAHPNIVTIHDIGRDDHRHYIVMEYVEGKTLKEIIRERYQNDQPIPISQALDLAIQICAGIGYAHRANLVHCDVKPQNVIVTRDERVKVADFGIARAVSQATGLHQESQIWGTPHYFSPEQAAGEAATPASDVYAIGIILFELLCGRLPFEAESQTAMALKHIQSPPPLITEFNPTVPVQLERIINKILSKEPAGRYRTAGQLGRILSTYRERSQADTGIVQPVLDQAGVPVSEQTTQIYQRPAGEETVQSAQDTPTSRATIRRPQSESDAFARTIYFPVPRTDGKTDWIAVALGIAALSALLGLIPLWYFVFRAWVG
ncbi:MAG TPA: protein kinase [Anaerolineae bacterium]